MTGSLLDRSGDRERRGILAAPAAKAATATPAERRPSFGSVDPPGCNWVLTPALVEAGGRLLRGL